MAANENIILTNTNSANTIPANDFDIRWTAQSVHAVIASFCAWALDAFDFFTMVFILGDIAKEFGAQISTVAWGLTVTLMMRPVGAYIFGRLADRYGRKPILLFDILLYSGFGVACGFAPSIAVLLILRAGFGIAMGGEWGIGASLTMETIPPKARGMISGILQCGYPSGYLFAAIVYALLYPSIGWRGMFMVGVIPALLLVLYMKIFVQESPSWREHRGAGTSSTLAVLRDHWRIALYAVAMMTAFSFYSHGTQDLYPTFLQKQHGFAPKEAGGIAIIYNIGAILGSIFFGTISQRIGRKRAMVIAALVSLPVIPLFAYSGQWEYLAAGAFLIQFMVQGAYGVIPAHLNELSPPGARGTFPGLVFQLGNLIAAGNANIQVWIATSQGGDYRIALAGVAATSALAIALLVGFGIEKRGVALASGRS